MVEEYKFTEQTIGEVTRGVGRFAKYAVKGAHLIVANSFVIPTFVRKAINHQLRMDRDPNLRDIEKGGNAPSFLGVFIGAGLGTLSEVATFSEVTHLAQDGNYMPATIAGTTILLTNTISGIYELGRRSISKERSELTTSQCLESKAQHSS